MLEELITAQLASVADGRRWWVRAPQDAPKPYVILHRVDGVPNYHFCGIGTIESRIQVNCVADTYAAAKSLSRDVIAALNTYEDRMNGIQKVFRENDGRDLDMNAPGDINQTDATNKLFAVGVDFTVVHNEVSSV